MLRACTDSQSYNDSLLFQVQKQSTCNARHSENAVEHNVHKHEKCVTTGRLQCTAIVVVV